MNALTIDISPDMIEKIAERAAQLVSSGSADSELSQPDGYLDVAGAAEFLSCPPSRIYALVSAKRIPHHKDGSRLLFDRRELREYVEAGGAVRP